MRSISSSAADWLGAQGRVIGDGARLARLAALADLLDSRWRVPGTSIRFGLDGIAGLVPILGDTATAIVSGYLVLEASRMQVSKGVLARMAGNVCLDWLLGSIPIIGTVFDIGFRANRRNVELLRRNLQRHAG